MKRKGTSNVAMKMRVEPQEVVEAYNKLSKDGYLPTSDTYCEGKYICPMTALYLTSDDSADIPVEMTGAFGNGIIEKWADVKYGEDYVDGFTSGVDFGDLDDPKSTLNYDTPRAFEGLSDGQHAWQAVKQVYAVREPFKD